MCPFLTGSFAAKVTIIFKSLEWFFWGWVIWGIVHVVNTRGCYNAAIKFCNWLIKLHDFDGQLISTEKAFQRFRRETFILLILNICVVILIRLL